MIPNPRHLLLLVVVLAAIAAACADDDDGGSTGAETEDPTASAPTSAPSTSVGATSTPPTTAVPDTTDAPVADSSAVDDPCDADALPIEAGDHQLTLTVAGEERTYWLYVPDSLDPSRPAPTLYNFHGLGSNGGQQLLYSTMLDDADEHGFLMVAPDGSSEGIDELRWPIEGVDAQGPAASLTFVDELIDSLESSFCLDPTRRYATGMSYGGIMSSALACLRADTFAAFAPVAATLHVENLDTDATCGGPVDLLAIHGTADSVVAFDGSETGTVELVNSAVPALSGGNLSIPDNVATFAAQSGCTTSTDLPFEGATPNPEFGVDAVTLRDWDCPPDAEVRLLIVEGGGHDWPRLGEAGFDAGEVIWDFVSSRTLGD